MIYIIIGIYIISFTGSWTFFHIIKVEDNKGLAIACTILPILNSLMLITVIIMLIAECLKQENVSRFADKFFNIK